MLFLFSFFVAFPSLALCCADHNIARHRGRSFNRRQSAAANWTYEASYNWHVLDPSYEICQTGTQQSPIRLPLDQGLSSSHIPTFRFPGHSNSGNNTSGTNSTNSSSSQTSVAGEYYNWGYGPAFTLLQNSSSAPPTIQFDNVSAVMIGWHIHAPADHSVGGDRSKAEIHVVWSDPDSGDYIAVTAIRLDPGRSNSAFFAQLDGLPRISWNDRTTRVPATFNFGVLLGDETRGLPGYFSEFWTYEGSMTSPPCTEGIRWFVARNIHWISIEQMQNLLSISTFSARAEQEVWLHRVNA